MLHPTDSMIDFLAILICFCSLAAIGHLVYESIIAPNRKTLLQAKILEAEIERYLLETISPQPNSPTNPTNNKELLMKKRIVLELDTVKALLFCAAWSVLFLFLASMTLFFNGFLWVALPFFVVFTTKYIANKITIVDEKS